MVEPGESFVNESAVGDSLNPHNYQLDILTIVNNEGIGMDVRNMFGECRIYESILNNFLMGEIAIVDALKPSLFEQLQFTGQEYLRIKFRHGDPNDNTSNSLYIDKLFRIYKVSDVQRQEQGQRMYKLSFCSPEFLTSRRYRISKVYRGSHPGIAAKIGQEYLNIQPPEGKSVSRYDTKGLQPTEPYWEKIAINDHREDYQFIIPNWTVNYTMNWLCNNAMESPDNAAMSKTSAFDSATFWYESASGGYKIQSLKDMLEQKILGGTKFVYSPVSEDETVQLKQTHNAKGEEFDEPKDIKVAGHKIINYQEGEHADFLEGIVFGMFGGEQTTVDFREKCYHERDYSYFNNYDKWGGLVEQEGSQYPMFREAAEVKWIGKPINVDEESGEAIGKLATEFKPTTNPKWPQELPAHEFKQAYNTLEYQTSHIFESGYKTNSEGFEPNKPKILLAKQAARKLLKYNTLTAQISARTDISAGKLITLFIPATDTGLDESAGDERPDNMNSGNHLVTEVMWSLMPTELKTNITCMRDTCLEKIEDYFKEQIVIPAPETEDNK